jgi:hypothetical protein
LARRGWLILFGVVGVTGACSSQPAIDGEKRFFVGERRRIEADNCRDGCKEAADATNARAAIFSSLLLPSVTILVASEGLGLEGSASSPPGEIEWSSLLFFKGREPSRIRRRKLSLVLSSDKTFEWRCIRADSIFFTIILGLQV